ncbi:hypothetical protein AB1Y20_012181 [Prymnesium parvum]|uniref:Uncharacterized protein n=1 Tax=Prymnesium parvum TaxID=97485 RepID=A0AB34IRE2_PRYPA
MKRQISLSLSNPRTMSHAMSDQTFADVKEILLSQSSVKDIVISINAEYWGTDWAEHEADRQEYEGVIAKWKTGDKTQLKVFFFFFLGI